MPHCPKCGEQIIDHCSPAEKAYQEATKNELDFELEQRLTFGKYKGQRLDLVFRTNPAYLKWAIDNVEFFNPSEALKARILNSTRAADPAFRDRPEDDFEDFDIPYYDHHYND